MKSLKISEELKMQLPKQVISNYSLVKYDSRLEDLMLSKYGLYDQNNMPYYVESKIPDRALLMCICKIILINNKSF